MAESKVRNESYYQVSGWMLNRLQLKGIELDVYAIIYGFSQDGESSFTGSLQYLSDFTNSTKPTVIKALKSLVEKGYIVKHESRVNGVKFNTYKANLEVVKVLYWSSKEILPGGKETLPGGSKKPLPGGSKGTLPNNKSLYTKDFDNKEDKKIPLADYSSTTFSDELKAKVDEWLRYKVERGDEYQPIGLQNLVSQIQNNVNKHGEQAVVELIGYCMASNWKGIIFDRLNNKQQTGGRKEIVPKWARQSETAPDRVQADMDRARRLLGSDPDLAARAEQLKKRISGEEERK